MFFFVLSINVKLNLLEVEYFQPKFEFTFKDRSTLTLELIMLRLKNKDNRDGYVFSNFLLKFQWLQKFVYRSIFIKFTLKVQNITPNISEQ